MKKYKVAKGQSVTDAGKVYSEGETFPRRVNKLVELGILVESEDETKEEKKKGK